MKDVHLKAAVARLAHATAELAASSMAVPGENRTMRIGSTVRDAYRAIELVETEVLGQKESRIDKLKAGLRRAEDQFTRYANLHEQKAPPEGNEKAETNRNLARDMRKTAEEIQS